jgi:hypothetical protein
MHCGQYALKARVLILVCVLLVFHLEQEHEEREGLIQHLRTERKRVAQYWSVPTAGWALLNTEACNSGMSIAQYWSVPTAGWALLNTGACQQRDGHCLQRSEP